MEMIGLIRHGDGKRDVNIITVAQKSGPVASSTGTKTVAEYSFTDCLPIDVLVIPGGEGTRNEIENDAMLNFLKTSYQNPSLRFFLSVCTGASLLAKAHLLDGKAATTNKKAFSWVTSVSSPSKDDGTDKQISWHKTARYVEHANIVTAAGVSAGIDAALYLIGKEYGLEMALNIAERAEYNGNWQESGNDPFQAV